MGFDENKTVSKVLKHLKFPVISNGECFEALDRVLPLNTFCAGYQNMQTAVCKGDSGGGLVFMEPVAGSERYVVKVYTVFKVTKELKILMYISDLTEL